MDPKCFRLPHWVKEARNTAEVKKAHNSTLSASAQTNEITTARSPDARQCCCNNFNISGKHFLWYKQRVAIYLGSVFHHANHPALPAFSENKNPWGGILNRKSQRPSVWKVAGVMGSNEKIKMMIESTKICRMNKPPKNRYWSPRNNFKKYRPSRSLAEEIIGQLNQYSLITFSDG